MVDRPMIFRGPMVRALWEGRKTQTRRMLKIQPAPDCELVNPPFRGDDQALYVQFRREDGDIGTSVPLGTGVGDRIWVRETFQIPALCDIQYRATDTARIGHWNPESGPWRSPVHMPRWASRIALTITDVRVERLHEITEEDAIAEGVCAFAESLDRPGAWAGVTSVERPQMVQVLYGSNRRAFTHLWETLHGADSWSLNPWVAVPAFDVARANIDSLPKSEAA